MAGHSVITWLCTWPVWQQFRKISMSRITGWSNRDSDFLPGDFAVDLEQYPYYIDILYHQYDQLKFPVCSDHDRRRPERKDRSFPELYVQAGIWSRCIRIRYGDRSCCIPLLVHTGSSCKQDYRQRSLRILERSEVEICMRKNTEFLHMYFTRFLSM